MNFGDLARSGTAPNAKYKTASLTPSLGGPGAQVRPKTRSGGDIDLNDFNVDLRTNKLTSQGNDLDNPEFRKIQSGDEYTKAMESFQAAVDNWSGKKDPTVADINSKRPESRNRITKDPKKASVLAAYTQNVPSILLQPSKKVKSVSSSPRTGKSTVNHFNELRAAYGADFVAPTIEKVASPTTVKVPKGPKLQQIARYQDESIEPPTTLRSSSAKQPSSSSSSSHHSSGGNNSSSGGGGAAGGETVRPHTVKSAYLSGGPVEVIRPPKKVSPTLQSHGRVSAAAPSSSSSGGGGGGYHSSNSSSAYASGNNNSNNYSGNTNSVPNSYSYDLGDFEDVEEDIIYVDSPHEQSTSSFTSSSFRDARSSNNNKPDPYENSKMPSSGQVSSIRSAVRNSQMYPDDILVTSGSPSESYLAEKILNKQNSRSLLQHASGGVTTSSSSSAPNSNTKRKGSSSANAASLSVMDPSSSAAAAIAVFSMDSEDGSPRNKVIPAVEVVELKTGEKLVDGSSSGAGGPVERPQSRKLYLGNEKSNSSSAGGGAKATLKAPRSAGARYSNFSPSHYQQHDSTGFEEGGPFSPDVGGSSVQHQQHPYELRRMSSFSAVQVTKPWLEEDHLPVRRPPSRQSSAFPVHLADAPGGGAATATGGGGGGAAVGNSSTEKAAAPGSSGTSSSLSSGVVTPSKSTSAASGSAVGSNGKLRRKEEGLIKASSASPPSPEVFLDCGSGDSQPPPGGFVQPTHRPPSRQKVAAQHLFEGLTSAPAGLSDSPSVGVGGASARNNNSGSATGSHHHSDADEVESEDELKVNSRGGKSAVMTPAGSVIAVPNSISNGGSGVPPTTAPPEHRASESPTTAQPRSRTAASRQNKNRNGLFYNPRDDGFSELDTNGVGGHLAPFAITVNYGPSAARVMLRDEDSDYIVIEEYPNHSGGGGAGGGGGKSTSSGNRNNKDTTSSSNSNANHRRIESSESVEYINLTSAASELSLISNTPRDSGMAPASSSGYHHTGNRPATLSWEDHTTSASMGGVSSSLSQGHLLPTRPKSVAGPSMKSPANNPRNNGSFYTQPPSGPGGGGGAGRVRSAGDSLHSSTNANRASTAGATAPSLMRPIEGGGKIGIKGSSPKTMSGGWTSEASAGAGGPRPPGSHFVESASQPNLGIRHMQTESPANMSYDTGNYIQVDDTDNVTIMSEESCREGNDSPLSVRSFTLESSLGEDFLNLFASRR